MRIHSESAGLAGASTHRNRSRRVAWAALVAIFCVSPAMPCPTFAAEASPAAKPPNIVFILIDDMGWADVGCFGSSLHETPHIDSLATGGMKFTAGYAACPVCSPTRASIMTGKYPARLQLTNFLKGKRALKGSPILPALYADQLDLEELTLAEVLKSAGYATCHVGKWHLGGESFLPQYQGFDVNIGGSHRGMPRSFFWPRWKDNPPVVGNFDGEYLPDRLSQEACKFIQAHRKGPFFLYLAHYAVHIPIEGKADKVAKYQKKLKDNPPPKGRQNNPHYAAMVESVDESVGRVLNTLKRLKLDENTVVVFFSDNGGLSTPEGKNTPATVNAPMRAGKGYLYEGGIREPCLIRWPGVTKPGAVCDEPVCSVDFFPTLCAAAGLDPRQVKTRGPIDGVSLTPLLRNAKAKLPPRALYWHYPHFSNQGGRPGGAVRQGDWKLIERYERGDLELYNLKNDVSETNNLAAKMPEKSRQMQEMLAAWRKDVRANMPRKNPQYREKEPTP